jgi:DNA-binding NarL/FixJ family response regulator
MARVAVAVSSGSLRRRLETILARGEWDMVACSSLAEAVARADTVVADGGALAARPAPARGDVQLIAVVSGAPDPFWTGEHRTQVAGIVDRDDPERELDAAVRAVLDGRGWVSPEFARDVLAAHVSRALADGPAPAPAVRAPVMAPVAPVQLALDGLTAREGDVVLAVSRGLSNAEISKELGIEVSTVKYHVSNILTKLACRDRSQLIAALHVWSRAKA